MASMISIFKGKPKETTIRRDTRRLQIIDADAHNRLSESEKMANLLKTDLSVPDRRFMFFSSGNEYKVHNVRVSLSVEASVESTFKLEIPTTSNREYFQISLLCPLWVPTRTGSEATMSLYIKDSAYLDPDKQRTLLGKFKVNKVTAIVWSMSHHLAVSDSDQIRLYIRMDDLDVKGTVMGTLKLAYAIRFADECLPSKPIDPGMTVFAHYQEKDYSKDVTNAIAQELIELYDTKSSDFIASLSKVIDRLRQVEADNDVKLNEVEEKTQMSVNVPKEEKKVSKLRRDYPHLFID